ncbi:hypothetical protein BC835DRAFT_948204 [Cytidiella melzeri]|nr:hypothetical protein BC835DRAFT_948204 [Cytidiella melzeri]
MAVVTGRKLNHTCNFNPYTPARPSTANPCIPSSHIIHALHIIISIFFFAFLPSIVSVRTATPLCCAAASLRNTEHNLQTRGNIGCLFFCLCVHATTRFPEHLKLLTYHTYDPCVLHSVYWKVYPSSPCEIHVLVFPRFVYLLPEDRHYYVLIAF